LDVDSRNILSFCIDVGSDFEEDEVTISCPSGCIEDLSSGNVYGTTIYTEVSKTSASALEFLLSHSFTCLFNEVHCYGA